MVHILVISIILFPTVTALGDEFWKDVDTKCNELTDTENLSTQKTLNDSSGLEELPTQPTLNDLSVSEDLPTQATTSEAQQIVPSFTGPVSNKPLHIRAPNRRSNPKHVSFQSTEMTPFEHAVTIDPTYPQNLSGTQIVDKLVVLGYSHEWPLLRLFDVEIYSKYWGFVCTYFSEVNVTYMPRVACRISPTFGKAKQRKSEYRGKIQFFDLLGCNCYGYEDNVCTPRTSTEKFLIHQSSASEFFVFEQKKIARHVRLIIKDFKGGLTLPRPFLP